jgi:phenylacetate-CoA ligase
VFSAYGWSLSRKRHSKFFYEQLSQLRETEWWSSDQIEAYQNLQLMQVVKHAYASTPFYKKWFAECGATIDDIKSLEDLKNLPILTKKVVKEFQSEMISNVYDKNKLIKHLTSGTTGTPLDVYFTSEGLAFQQAVWWRHKARFGLSPKDKHLTFGARVPIDEQQSSPPYWRNDIFNNRVYLSSYHIGRSTVKDIVDYLNKSKFVFYTGYPSSMYSLAALMDEMGLYLLNPPRYVVTGSDALLPRYQSLISRVFRSPVTEQYGMTEFAGNLSKCEYGRFHVDFECCHVEHEVQESSGLYKLLLTGWGNKAMPFIRSEVGDYATQSQAPCPCGRKSACYDSIDGRLEDYIVTPDGRRLIGMNQVFEYAKNAKQMQIYQSSLDAVEFRIIPDAGFGDADKDALIREFRRRAGSGIQIKFRLVDQMILSSSGKLKAVISEIK